jgi:hemolysin D
MTKLSWLTVFTTVTLTSQAFIIPSHGQSSYCSILAQGKLEPSAAVQKVQSPISGMVKKVYVRNGDRVKAGDPLIQIESERPSALLTQLQTENQSYRSRLSSSATDQFSLPPSLENINLKPDTARLLDSRAALIAENRSFHAKLFQSNNLLKSKEQNRLRHQNLVVQIEGAKSRIKADRIRLAAETSQIDKQIAQNSARIIAAKQSLATNQSILNDIKPAAEVGAVSRVQVARQELEVKNRFIELEQQNQEKDYLLAQKKYVLTSHSNYEIYQQEAIKEYQVEISRLDREFAKLQINSGEQTSRTGQNSVQDRALLYEKIATNDKHIAEIDSLINKIIIENERKIAVIMSQPQNPKYQEVRSPINGIVFELNSTPGLIIKPNSDQPLVQIVPEDNLIAKVYLMDKDISYVKNGMPVNVKIDSFPFDTVNNVQGTLEWIGADVIPPDQAYGYSRFPARIILKKQTMKVKRNGVFQEVRLQTGMSVNAVIQPQQCSR